MPHLIIGHVTDTTARVWVRGDSKSRTCEIALRHPGGQHTETVVLTADTDFTGIADFRELEAGTSYIVHATFGPSAIRLRGRLRTIARSPANGPLPFSFVLSSCNLSVVSVNNFLALLAATAGTQLGMSSLDLPLWRWKGPPFQWLRMLLRYPLKLTLGGVAWLIQRFTRVKQPGQPYLRSPFLKLSAVFDSWVLEVTPARRPDRHEAADARENRPFLAVGDHVQSSWGATGVVASTDSFDDEETRAPDDNAGPGCDVPRVKAPLKPRQLVLAQVDGKFEQGDVLIRKVSSDSASTVRRLGEITSVKPGRSWYEPPAFFIHAGDQIYYDFPSPDRIPDRDEYRIAYREAWFEDDAQRHVLAHWPHYMTLDDHEIADQFARDFKPPAALYSPGEYLTEAGVAYGEYVHALSPPGPNNPAIPKCGPYSYTFNRGAAQFFVLDTRSQRRDGARGTTDGTMIDETQMTAFLEWLQWHKEALKFVVTSVPFVAELNTTASEEKQDWFKDQPSTERERECASDRRSRNPEHDKWSAERFRCQRDRIIEFIAEQRIEHVVFLTGDMHCCYHATMRIGDGPKKYESIIVHELAGGPLNQLQLSNALEFKRRCTKRTVYCNPVDYETVLERFHSGASAVMHVKVEYVRRQQVTRDGSTLVPEVEWNVIRTLTDPGPAAWPTGQLSAPHGNRRDQPGEPVMAGRISFVKQRSADTLQPWPAASVSAAPHAGARS